MCSLQDNLSIIHDEDLVDELCEEIEVMLYNNHHLSFGNNFIEELDDLSF
jgi:hypothetical protein